MVDVAVSHKFCTWPRPHNRYKSHFTCFKAFLTIFPERERIKTRECKKDIVKYVKNECSDVEDAM